MRRTTSSSGALTQREPPANAIASRRNGQRHDGGRGGRSARCGTPAGPRHRRRPRPTPRRSSSRRGTDERSPPSSARGTAPARDGPSVSRFGSIRSCWTFGQPATHSPSPGEAVMLHARIETPSAPGAGARVVRDDEALEQLLAVARDVHLAVEPDEIVDVSDRLDLDGRADIGVESPERVGRGEPDLSALDGDLCGRRGGRCGGERPCRWLRRSERCAPPGDAAACRRAGRGRHRPRRDERDDGRHRGGERARATCADERRARAPRAPRRRVLPHVGWRSSGSFAIARARTSSSASGSASRRSLARGGGVSRCA